MMGIVIGFVFAILTTSAKAEEVPMVCPKVIPLAVERCNAEATVSSLDGTRSCMFGHKATYGHDYTIIEFDGTGGIIMQGSFKGVIIDYDADGRVDRKPALFGGYDSRKNAAGRNGTMYPQGKFSAAQEVYEDECRLLAPIFLPEEVAAAAKPSVE